MAKKGKTSVKKKKKVKQRTPDYAWCIAYINGEHIHRAEKEMSRNPEFEDVILNIPTVRILTKTFKGQNIFKEIPLLFNYGFFRIPHSKAIDPEFLSSLKSGVTCIVGWVKNTSDTYANPKLRRDNRVNAGVQCATATSEEIARLIEASSRVTIYSKDDLHNLTPGSVITLRGYPWDGLSATVLEINLKKKTVKAEIDLEGYSRKVANLSFDNVFYSIYQGGYDPEAPTEKPLEQFNSGLSSNLVVKLSSNED